MGERVGQEPPQVTIIPPALLSFDGVLGATGDSGLAAAQEPPASDGEQEDEGVVSVVDFDTPRSPDVTPSGRRSDQLRIEQDALNDTASSWGMGDTIMSTTSLGP